MQLITYNNLIHGFHTSNSTFHDLSIQLIIKFLLNFDRSVKPTTRFLTQILKL